MSLLAGYRASLKPLEVEEPIDVYLHRPLAYLLARALLPTRVTPNAVTFAALVFGVASGICFALPFRFHFPVGAACLFVGTVLDCADGQLARLRKAYSEFGRLLDGFCDSMTLVSIVASSAWIVVRTHMDPPWHGAIALVLALVTIQTTHLHLTAYDHYKNVFVRISCPGAREGEDIDRVVERHERLRASGRIGLRVMSAFYVGFLTRQRDFLAWFDPYTNVHLDALPPYDEERAATYKKHAALPLVILRSFMGMGSLVFGMAVFGAFGRFDIYLLFRLVVLNAIFWLVFAPLQRRASRDAFREMGLAPAPQQAAVAT